MVIIFTFEWAARLYVAPEDDTTRCTYILSFYSLVDLCAILPWCRTNPNPNKPSEPDTAHTRYIALANPGGFFDEYDEQLRHCAPLYIESATAGCPGLRIEHASKRRLSHVRKSVCSHDARLVLAQDAPDAPAIEAGQVRPFHHLD